MDTDQCIQKLVRTKQEGSKHTQCKIEETVQYWVAQEKKAVMNYSDSKNLFYTNPKCGVRSVPPYSVGIPLSFGGVIYSSFPWLQDCSLGHVIWATGCRDMINLKQQYHGKGFFTFEMKWVFVYYQFLV